MFDSYVQTGRVDLSVRGRGGGGPRPEGSDFVGLDAAWEAEMGRRGLAPATREAYGRVARSYLVFLEGRGMAVLDGADGASVLAFLESLLDRWAKSSLFWVVSNFRPFLKFTGRTDLVNALNLAGIKRFHAIVPVLEDTDQELVVHACASGVVSARDAAITLLALSTGLSACDIVALRMGDVDWRGRTVGLVQQKTGNPLTLPLPALLLGKLAAYVLDERPSSADDHLFLRSVAPHTRLGDHATVHRVTVETFRKAGVNQLKAGTRLLRHNAASRLLAAAVPLPTISAVLGHAHPESTNLYMSVDRLRLLDCVLPTMLAGLIPSVGTVGDALDNALCETTIGLYKTECVREGSPFRSGPIRTLADLENITSAWVSWYNEHRLMHRLRRIPPAEAEAEYYARLQAGDPIGRP